MAETETGQTVDIASLWRSYATKKTQAVRNRLAEYYLPLVKSVATRLAIGLPTHVDRDDLLSSGFFGLLDAIDRYDTERKNKFETYAGMRIRGAMLDYLRANDWIPVTVRKKIRAYEGAVAKLENELGRPAEDGEIAAALSISLEELHSLISRLQVVSLLSLDEYMRMERPDSTQGTPGDNVEAEAVRDALAQAIDRLPDKERLVVSLYYYDELTLKEISRIMNLTEARISQMHTKAVLRLRGSLSRLKSSLL